MPATLQRIVSFPVFLGAVLVVCVYYLGSHGIADPDIWWHLRNAEYLVKTHHFIRYDMYSSTVLGKPWMDHEWLAELPYYFGWKLGGYRGIFCVMMALIELVILGVYWLGYLVSGNSKAAFTATYLAVFLATVSFGPRTLLFGWIFLILLIAILWTYRNRRADFLWLLPPLFLVWINTHGSWLIGLIVLALFIVAGLAEGSFGVVEARRWSPAELKKLLQVAGLSVALLFVNPYGYRLVLYPFDLAFRQKLNVSNIEEWASVDFHSLRGKILLAVIIAILMMSLMRKQAWRLELLLLFFFGLYTSVTYMRFLFLAGIIFSPILAQRMNFFPTYHRENDKPWINSLLIAAALVFLVLRFPTQAALGRDIQQEYPVIAAPKMQALVESQPGVVLTDFLWGGYLIWNQRDLPVFIDSRVDVYEYNGVVKDYLDFNGLRRSYEILSKYKVSYVFINSESPMMYFLKHSPEWQVYYQDAAATIFTQSGAHIPPLSSQ